MEDDLLGTGADIVHGSHPGQGILPLQIFLDAFGCRQLSDEEVPAVQGLLIEIGQKAGKLTGEDQRVIADGDDTP